MTAYYQALAREKRKLPKLSEYVNGSGMQTTLNPTYFIHVHVPTYGGADIILGRGTDYSHLDISSILNNTTGFAGFYTGQNGTGTKYYNENGESVATWNGSTILNLYPYYE